ncbi:hypothetical protein [Cysteiniphilum halobium]|uniref:hypothetical protein n=1 Tax=Cysteiniphilum halobium TaxID=2219059 RepID=UPI000E656512|nr:hypothetical protein [Cysteiniphilum halobium]
MEHDITPIESLFVCGLKKSQIADKLKIPLRSVQFEIQKLKEVHNCDTDVQLALKIFTSRFDCLPTIKMDNEIKKPDNVLNIDESITENIERTSRKAKTYSQRVAKLS